MRLLTASVGPFNTRERTPGYDLSVPAGDGAAELVDLWGAGLVLDLAGDYPPAQSPQLLHAIASRYASVPRNHPQGRPHHSILLSPE